MHKRIILITVFGLVGTACVPHNIAAVSAVTNKISSYVNNPYVQDFLAVAKNAWISATRKSLGAFPHYNEVATVRIGHELPANEITATQSRKQHKVQQALQNMLGTEVPIDRVPTIAFCCSGGGYRAMIATLGFLQGAEKIGLLDATTYMSALSGSTWLLAPWLYRNVSLDNYSQILAPRLTTALPKVPFKKADFASTLNKKIAYGQPISSVDVWGALIINALAGDLGFSGQGLKLSSLANRVGTGSHLFPIFTSAMVCEKGKPYQWMEFTPYEIGSSYLGAYVPTWSFGRKFFAGRSIDFAPEQDLGYGLGIFGSAYTASAAEARVEIKSIIGADVVGIAQGILPKAARDWIGKYDISEQRISPARAYNFTYKCGAMRKADEPLLTCIDAAMAFNLPFPPLLRPERHVDIIVVCDASGGVKNSPALRGAEDYAKRKGLKFPLINYEGIDQRIVSVFKDITDVTVPVVIYFPRIPNPDYNANFDPGKAKFCGTTNFMYKPDEFELLRGLMEAAVISSKNIIVDEIKNRIEACQKTI